MRFEQKIAMLRVRSGGSCLSCRVRMSWGLDCEKLIPEYEAAWESWPVNLAPIWVSNSVLNDVLYLCPAMFNGGLSPDWNPKYAHNHRNIHFKIWDENQYKNDWEGMPKLHWYLQWMKPDNEIIQSIDRISRQTFGVELD